MFDDILSIEDEQQEKGRLEGFKNGQMQALKDACEFGMRNGFAVAKEIAYAKTYSLLLQQRLQLERTEDHPSSTSVFAGRERLDKLLVEIIALAGTFSLQNNLDQNLEHLLKSTRQKFKLAQALYNSSGGKVSNTDQKKHDLSF